MAILPVPLAAEVFLPCCAKPPEQGSALHRLLSEFKSKKTELLWLWCKLQTKQGFGWTNFTFFYMSLSWRSARLCSRSCEEALVPFSSVQIVWQMLLNLAGLALANGKRLTCAHKTDSVVHTDFWLSCTHKIDSLVHTTLGGGVGLGKKRVGSTSHTTPVA